MKLVSKKNGTTTIFPNLISALASKIGFTPPSGMSSTNVQDAIEESLKTVNTSKDTGSIVLRTSALGLTLDANDIFFVIPLPFHCANTNYTITLTTDGFIENVGYVSASSFSVQTKLNDSFRLEWARTSSVGQMYIGQFTYTLTFN